MTDKTIYCAQAFGSVAINSSGEYISCCNIRSNEWEYATTKDPSIRQLDPKDRINQENLRKVRGELINGTWPKVCENCRVAESNGVQSMRTIWNKELEHVNIPANEYVDPNDIRYLDLTFSTKCNSKCMTCNAFASDFWEEESTHIWKAPPPKIDRLNIKDEQADKLVSQFPNVERISFIGGEPTISDEHVRYLKKLIEVGRSNDIKISYVTNLTGVTDELIEMWRHFKHVHVAVSVDGYGKVNEYIRYPFKWQKVESNIRKLFQMVLDSHNDGNETKFSISLSCTVSLFNAIQCFDLLDFWFTLTTEYKNEFHSLSGGTGCFVNCVTNPEYALVSLLSPEYRQQGILKGNQLLAKMDRYEQDNPGELVNYGFRDSIRLAMAWLNDQQEHSKVYLKNCRHFITASDLFRKRHIKDYIPELWEELEKLWQSSLTGRDTYS